MLKKNDILILRINQKKMKDKINKLKNRDKIIKDLKDNYVFFILTHNQKIKKETKLKNKNQPFQVLQKKILLLNLVH